MIEVTAATLAAHPFLHGVSPDHLAVLARAASDVTFPAGHRFFEDGGHATCFWLVQEQADHRLYAASRDTLRKPVK